jgi:hypothetical protein
LRWQALFVTLIFWAEGSAPACNWGTNEQLTISGEFEDGGLRGTFGRTIVPESGRFVESIDLRSIKRGSGFDGKLAWSRDVSGASHYLSSTFAKRLAVSEAWLTGHLDCPRPVRSAKAIHLDNDRAAGVHGWRFAPPGGAPIELWYDDHSGRLDHATLQYSENRIVHHFADWREVMPGRFIPYLQKDEDPEDESERIYTVRDVRLGTASRPFGPPPPPDDATIIGGGSAAVPFEDDQRHRLFVPVYLNGKGPFTFELDNGGHFIVTEETAAALGLKGQGSFASTGAGTEVRQASYLPIANLRVGNAVLAHQTAKVLPLSHNERPGLPPRAGLLGLEFFERFIVGIDHRKKTVTLRLFSDQTAPHLGRALPITFDEDAPLTDGGFDGAMGVVMLDIGNASPTIVEHFWAAQNHLVPQLLNGTPRGSGKLSKGQVRIGPFKLSDESVVYFGSAERGSEHTRSVALMVGEPLLSRFNATYDYSRQTVWLDPLPDVQAVSFDLH